MTPPWGLWALLPPIIAIATAILSRRVVPSLLAGLAAGAVMLSGGDLVAATWQLFTWHLWPALVEPDRLAVVVFTLLMGAMVAVIAQTGGMRALVEGLARYASTAQRGQALTWLLGLVVFFDDYANTVLLGQTLSPLADRLRISREKLAYLVDSTSAPVAGLALVSTWIAGELDYIQNGLNQLGLPGDASAMTPVSLFVASLPYRFYLWLTLLLVGVVAISGRDIPPMLQAERRARAATPVATSSGRAPLSAWRGLLAIVPIVVCVASILAAMAWSGQTAWREANPDAETTPGLMDLFGQANAFHSLMWGAMFGLATAIGLALGPGRVSRRRVRGACVRGAKLMLPALVILWLSGALSEMTRGEPVFTDQPSADALSPSPFEPDTASESEAPSPDGAVSSVQQPTEGSTSENRESKNPESEARASETIPSTVPDEPAPSGLATFPEADRKLYTGVVLQDLVSARVPSAALPIVIFVLAAFVSFATGTSWGTMGLVMPFAIPLAAAALRAEGLAVTGDNPVLLGVVGSVLAGSIFGDHASPLSDTTILSSQACGCHHIDHVRTQIPYAFLGGLVSIGVGQIPLAIGVPLLVAWPLAIGGLIGGFWLVSQPVLTSPAPEATESASAPEAAP